MRAPPSIAVAAAGARPAAAAAIRRWLETGRLPVDRLDAATDRGFAMDLAYGVVKRYRTLRWLGRRLADREPPAAVAVHVWLGLQQLFFAGIPAHAAVHATVEAAKPFLSPASTAFLNAVLRRAAREYDSLSRRLRKQSLGLRESHPDILVKRWTRQFGHRHARELCRWNNQAPPLVIRVNLTRTTAAEYRARLLALGLRAETPAAAPDRCLIVPHGVRVRDLPGYAGGLFVVQDPSTLAAADLLAPRPGERILDACAAPGGKTLLLAELMRDAGELVAMDVDADRLAVLRENLRRAGFRSVRAVADDVRRAGNRDLFDGVLLDAPCTNTGVLRRRPEARWRFSAAALKRLAGLQTGLLEAAAGLTRPGGRIVYSTCSLEPEEGGELVAGWRRGHPEFQLAAEVRLLPFAAATDGAYCALLRRTGRRPRRAARTRGGSGIRNRKRSPARDTFSPHGAKKLQ